jgi:hypothetical protein
MTTWIGRAWTKRGRWNVMMSDEELGKVADQLWNMVEDGAADHMTPEDEKKAVAILRGIYKYGKKMGKRG